ncbi:SUMF1/EgtB/PvdO family nonheme iron enzyme [Desulfopila aestuarii]|uniref:Sulfatase-modifying factor enzyme 1 n=1 Tax=Desulfopila aestuarii DSM 18488 TaxID=1121416 RepID=A0A1M7YHI4_9BACT|nr:SUMF1/EgtB/PvdO family nonheme iron enzyme [Desulfopila aestuarii]SHO52105.1 Sulfatase-modifying factor enzyme 1 [Desulfopila aestuarii DSM 18488]
MNSDGISGWNLWVVRVAVIVALTLPCPLLLPVRAWAEPPPQTVYNPKPAEGDLILPMPGEAEMVFRRVQVPGSGFWGDRSRIIQIGDGAGSIFEGLQRTQISGSFPTADGKVWEIVLGKYEVTCGQYIAVMGMDALLAASGDPEVQKLPTLEGRAQRDALMRPLAYVSHGDLLEFVRRYNQWLFDAAHPERLEAMPRIDGAPGFLRLPAEDEWEYVARGGLPAIEGGTFDNGLPFPAAEASEYAWHLGNAKHQLRPVGLRKPDGLGFHDLFGNVQEMTSGLFRPEIWQGKPGGVAVRGGSVSSPPAELRSAFRAELDVYAWNVDEKTVEERRSFNTGARLAIGANVVVTSAQRAEIEKEYEAYRQELRRTTPVGRTLDNLVAQASVQLGDVDPILARLIQENENLREPLTAVQASLEKARERLELAQRESARSLAQDAARNGVNLSVYLSRLQRLEATLKTAQELAAVSARYQEQVTAVEKSVAELTTALKAQLEGYRDKVASLGDYEKGYIEYAFAQLGGREMTARERAVMELLQLHVQDFAEKRHAEAEVWLEAFRKRFDGFSDSST